MKFMAGVVQMTSTPDVEHNIARALELTAVAAGRGAKLIGLPENWSHIRDNDSPAPAPVDLECGFILKFRELCRKEKTTLIAGTIPRPGPGGKIYNSCIVFGPDGNPVAEYRKIHLFDINIPGGASHEESRIVEPGDRVVVAQTEFGPVGLTVCYDLRFPELFRRLTLSGARMIFVPSAFTLYTGKDHWATLLRARAIENQMYIAAPAQFGRHSAERRSYGKSLIADPWGNVTALAEDRETVAIAEIDFDYQDTLRSGLPCLKHIQTWLT